jgi:hypothetical protein
MHTRGMATQQRVTRSAHWGGQQAYTVRQTDGAAWGSRLCSGQLREVAMHSERRGAVVIPPIPRMSLYQEGPDSRIICFCAYRIRHASNPNRTHVR